MGHAGIRVERAHDLFDKIALLGRDIGDLVDHHDIGELDLVHEQINKRALIAFPGRLATIPQEIG